MQLLIWERDLEGRWLQTLMLSVKALMSLQISLIIMGLLMEVTEVLVIQDAIINRVVGESGLFTPDDVAYVQEAGVKAVSYISSEHIAFFV